MVENTFHQPNVKGSCLGNNWEKMVQMVIKVVIAQGQNTCLIIPRSRVQIPHLPLAMTERKMTQMLINATMAQRFNNCFTNPKSKVHIQHLILAFGKEKWLMNQQQHNGRKHVSSAQCQRFMSCQQEGENGTDVDKSSDSPGVEHLAHHPKGIGLKSRHWQLNREMGKSVDETSSNVHVQG